MSTSKQIDGPFPFSPADLEADNLIVGVRHTLDHFYQWRDRNSAAIAAHVGRYTDQVDQIVSGNRFPHNWARRVLPGKRRNEAYLRVARDVNYFAMYNLAEIPDPGIVDKVIGEFRGRLPSVGDIIASIEENRGVSGVVAALEHHLPVLAGVPEMAWLTERLDRLYRILPEIVVGNGGMGKVVRAMAGVLAIGAYDTLAESREIARERMAGILPGAYALGAAYVIVDDTLQDLPAGYLSSSDRQRYHQVILRGLRTGQPIDDSAVPDHPLAGELHALYQLVLARYPFAEYRHLYCAAEAMYLAQHRDSLRAVDEIGDAGDLEGMYPDILIKSGMSRIVANILARRSLGEGFYGRCINTIFLGQFKDDLRDREDDLRAGRLTPFTLPAGRMNGNPLYDLFAYDAYVAAEVFDGDEAVVDALAYIGAGKLASHLAGRRQAVDELTRTYEATSDIDTFLRAVSSMPPDAVRDWESADTRLKNHCARVLCRREQTIVDARTFVADRLPYINEVTKRCYPAENRTRLDDIVAYAMEAPGKRLRPALGLMLAAGLAVDPASIEPFVAASELFHTASLLFDDLPAQDNASMRRGRPTAHTVFDEGSVQLAAVAMISSGFGLLGELGARFPAEKVTEVISYVGTVLGPTRLCRGQDLDLHMGKSGAAVTGPEILEMYELKTSTTLEAALVPLMMLVDRPPAETELVKRYAYHAGIVFQIRDDILDVTSSTESLGKDTDNDVDKVNVVRTFGLAEAERLMRRHLDDAVACCARLPFPTDLLRGMVVYFAERGK